MTKIRPLSDLRNNFKEVSDEVHESNQPIFFTKNGVGDMVVMSIETYDNLHFESEVYTKLMIAEQEAEFNPQRYSSKDILKAIQKSIKDTSENV
jgi:prevent-host-death family protein